MNALGQTKMSELRPNDILEVSRLFEAEYNQPKLHDRVLIFDVVALPARRLSVGNIKESEKKEACGQNEDQTDGDTADIANDEKDDNLVENQLGNKNESSDTAANENGAFFTDNKTSVETRQANEKNETNDHDIPLEITQNKRNENKIESQYESEITSDDNDVTPRLNDEEKNGNSANIPSCESNEATNYPTRERQEMRQHKIYIHSQWLAVQSSYFCSLLFSGAKEPNALEVHVQISASEEKAHLMLLESMYKIDTLDNANLDELLEVLKLAHKYDVKFVFRKCKYCLQAMAPCIEMFEKIIRLKVDHSIKNVDDLEKVAETFLTKEFSPLDKTWQTERFKELSKTMLRLLLSSDKLVTVSENTVFHALMHWVKQHGIDEALESQELPSLLSVVRFELIPIDYLYCIVQHHSVAKKLPDFKEHYLRGITYHALSSRLPRPPVRKNAVVKPFIPYTWTITANKLDEVVQSGKPHNSGAFWYCGYKIVLAISNIVKIEYLEGNKALFSATLSLAITNLTKQSEVSIRWQAASPSFTSFFGGKTSTFTEKARVSSFEIRYEVEVTQEQSSNNVTECVTISESISSTSSSKPNDGLSSSTPPPSTCPGAGTTITTQRPLQASDDPNSNFPQSNVNTSPATATLSGFKSSTTSSTSSSGLNFTFPQSDVNTGTRKTTAMTGFTPSTLSSTSSSGLNFTFPQSSVSTSARTTTVTGLKPSTLLSTLPPTTSTGLNFTFPPSSASTSARTATVTGLKPSTLLSTLPSTSSSGLNFTFPQSSVSTSARTTTVTGFTSSTLSSTSSAGLNLTFPQSSVKTSPATAPSTSTGFYYTFPSSRVKTSAGTTIVTGITPPTLPFIPPSTSSGGLNFTFSQSSVKTSATTKLSGYTPSTLPSTSSSGPNFKFSQSSVKTSATATLTGFTPSTLPSTSNSGLNFTFPQSSANTSARTTTPFTLPCTLTSTPSGGLNFTFPRSNVNTSAGTTTMTGIASFAISTLSCGINFTFQSGTAEMPGLTPPSTLSSGFAGTLRTRKHRNRNNKPSVSKQKNPNATCLSIDVYISLV